MDSMVKECVSKLFNIISMCNSQEKMWMTDQMAHFYIISANND